jgi:arginyl-tRNA synthetase
MHVRVRVCVWGGAHRFAVFGCGCLKQGAGGLQAVRLVELLDEARDRCKETISEKRGDDMTPEEIEHAAAAMGYGAVKYADLKNHRTTDYKCETPAGRFLP